MMEGPLLLALLLRRFRFDTGGGAEPVPVAFLTVRARDGIRLRVSER
jgi:cytochrome P450